MPEIVIIIAIAGNCDLIDEQFFVVSSGSLSLKYTSFYA